MQWEREPDQPPVSSVQSECAWSTCQPRCLSAQLPKRLMTADRRGEVVSIGYLNWRDTRLNFRPGVRIVRSSAIFLSTAKQILRWFLNIATRTSICIAIRRVYYYSIPCYINRQLSHPSHIKPPKQLLITTSRVFLEILRSCHKISPSPHRPWPEPSMSDGICRLTRLRNMFTPSCDACPITSHFYINTIRSS
jgi:hypothetical protein